MDGPRIGVWDWKPVNACLIWLLMGWTFLYWFCKACWDWNWPLDDGRKKNWFLVGFWNLNWFLKGCCPLIGCWDWGGPLMGSWDTVGLFVCFTPIFVWYCWNWIWSLVVSGGTIGLTACTFSFFPWYSWAKLSKFEKSASSTSVFGLNYKIKRPFNPF